MNQVIRIVDRFFSEYLGCDIGGVLAGEKRVVASERRCRPEMGYGSIFALWAILTKNRLAVSAQIGLLKLADCLDIDTLQDSKQELARAASDILGRKIDVHSGPIFYCTAESFQPQRFHPCLKVTPDLLPLLTGIVGDHHGLDHSIGEGTCFAAPNGDEPVSVSGTHAVPHIAHAIADMNVPGTIAEFRGRGFGKSAVSATTEAILAQGKTPVYITGDRNIASINTARSVGYLDYGWQLKLCYIAE